MSMDDLYLALLKIAPTWAMSLLKKLFRKSAISIDELRRRTSILFIDDERLDFLLENIRQSGWNARQVTEISNIYAEEVKNADIIFVDYKNVGATLTPSEEGIGLLKYLRQKYPQKHLIFFSGYAGFIPGHEIHGIADGWIQKNADPYIYIERIEEAAKRIHGRK